VLKKVLVAIDGSRHADKAMKTVKDLLRLDPSLEVSLLFVNDVPNNIFGLNAEPSPASFERLSTENTKRILASAEEFFTMDGYRVRTLCKFGSPATVICELAKYESFDLIVVGSRGLGAVKGIFMGSVSSKVAHLAHCPVLIVK